MPKVKNIYEIFSEYTFEQVNGAISKLSEEERNLLYSVYGSDLKTPDFKQLSSKSKQEIINIRAKIKRLVKNPEMQQRRRINNIYEYFNNYPVEQIDKAVSSLSSENLEILYLRFGPDLKNPINTKKRISSSETNHFYKKIIPEIEQYLKINGQILNEIQTNEQVEEPNNFYSTSEVIQAIPKTESTKSDLTKEDYEILLNIIKTPVFGEMIKLLTPTEAMVVSLRLIYSDNPSLNSKAVSEFMGISPDQVNEITKKALLIYKDKINNLIDKAIEVVSDKQLIIK